jgi:RNA polymerase sigma-70 factor (ECF subfamily)
MEDAIEPRAFTGERENEAEDALVAEAARTDASAFGELYERYHARVYRYVYHRVGNTADAEDITAVVFMKALEALPNFQSRRSGFAPWLFRITRNTVVDHYRRGRRQEPIDDLEHYAPNADPLHHALGSESRAELHALVHDLSPDQRDVILLRFAADLSFEEIAGILKKNEPAVRMLLHRGLRNLKAVMDNA